MREAFPEEGMWKKILQTEHGKVRKVWNTTVVWNLGPRVAADAEISLGAVTPC